LVFFLLLLQGLGKGRPTLGNWFKELNFFEKGVNYSYSAIRKEDYFHKDWGWLKGYWNWGNH